MPTFGVTIKLDRHNLETNRLRIGIRGKMVVAIVHLVGWHKSCERLEIISREYVTEEVQEGNHNSLSPQMWCSCWRIRTTIRLANSYSKPTSFRQNWSFWCPYTKTSAKCRRILQAKTIFCLWQVWWGFYVFCFKEYHTSWLQVLAIGTHNWQDTCSTKESFIPFYILHCHIIVLY